MSQFKNYSNFLPSRNVIDPSSLSLIIEKRRLKTSQILWILAVIFVGCKTNNKTFLNENLNLYPIGQNDKWGFVNEQGDLVIAYKFDQVSLFVEDRAAAKYKGKFGFINSNGEFIGKSRYDSIGYFNAKEAIVKKRGKYLTIDRDGKKLDKGIIRFNEGLSKLNSNPLDHFQLVDNQYVLNEKDFANEKRLDPNSNFKISDFTFKEVIPLSSKSFIVKKDNKYGIYVLNFIGLKDF